MRPSPWFLGGLAATILAGLAFFGLALTKLGPSAVQENPGGGGKPLLAEAKKKAEFLEKEHQKVAETSSRFGGLQGMEGEHRVFVSAQLVYLPENTEPVQPLDPKMVTEDGIEVGWKKNYRLDPADPDVKDEDPDGDGFTNLEEYLAKTDPTRKEDSPAKESKLKSRSGEPFVMAVSFPEKSGGLYSIRFQIGNKRREFKGKPGDSFWVMAGPEGVEIFSDETKADAAKIKAKEAAQNTHLIPLKFVSYEEKVERVKDAKAGGVEVEVDNSVVVLQRDDAIRGSEKLIFSTPQRLQTLSWDVGEIRLFSPASGGVQLGPYRVGEAFEYEGKKFAVIGREQQKIKLQDLTDPTREPFWVPPDLASPPAEKAP